MNQNTNDYLLSMTDGTLSYTSSSSSSSGATTSSSSNCVYPNNYQTFFNAYYETNPFGYNRQTDAYYNASYSNTCYPNTMVQLSPPQSLSSNSSLSSDQQISATFPSQYSQTPAKSECIKRKRGVDDDEEDQIDKVNKKLAKKDVHNQVPAASAIFKWMQIKRTPAKTAGKSTYF
jgi:hypothetical protein